MAPNPTRPALRARYDRRQEALLDEAARAFSRRGYDQTSIAQLAETLGMAAGSLYHYFGAKEQLLIRICERIMDPLLQDAEALVEQGGDPGEQLRDLVRLWTGHVITHQHHMLVFGQERHVIEFGPQWKEVRRRRKRFERVVDDVLQRVEEDGRATFADRRLALAALLGMVNHTALWFRPNGRLDATEIADGYVALLLGPAGPRRA